MEELNEKRIAIIRALEKQMETCPLDAVKVSQICKEVGIARSTFYDYFIDIYDVPNWFWTYLQQTGLFAIGVTKNLYDGMLINFQHLREYQNFFQQAFKSTVYNSLFQSGYRNASEHFEEILSYRLGRPLNDEESMMLFIYGQGTTVAAQKWAESGMCEPPEVMANVFTKMCPAWIRKRLEPGDVPESLQSTQTD